MHTNTLQLWQEGLWHRNPALVMLLGLCPLLAVSNSFANGAALAAATLITLCVSNTLIAALRKRVRPRMSVKNKHYSHSHTTTIGNTYSVSRYYSGNKLVFGLTGQILRIGIHK